MICVLHIINSSYTDEPMQVPEACIRRMHVWMLAAGRPLYLTYYVNELLAAEQVICQYGKRLSANAVMRLSYRIQNLKNPYLEKEPSLEKSGRLHYPKKSLGLLHWATIVPNEDFRPAVFIGCLLPATS